MREVLFRGKRKSDEQWIYGRLSYNGLGDTMKIIENNFFKEIQIVSDTIGQYTGLTDKNGVKIFEGDIIRNLEQYEIQKSYADRGMRVENLELYRKNARVGVVKFETEGVASCGCCYTGFGGTGFKADYIDMNCCEVIGNIYDNPELLKEV